MSLPSYPPAACRLRRRTLLLAAAPAGLGLMGGSLQAIAQSSARPLLLGTSTPGGGFSLYGETLERVLNGRGGGGAAVLRTRLTRGSVENLELLRSGEIDAALIQGTSAGEVLEQGAAQPLRILFAMYPSPGMLAVPAASGARRLEDLRGQPVVFGVRTSGLVTLARQVFTGIGLDIDRDFKAIYVEQAAQSPKLVLAGEAAGLWGAGEGWPGFMQLAGSPGGARFLGPTVAQIPQILRQYPLLQGMTVPPRSYAGIEQPLPTVGSVNLILVRADLDEARATRFLRAMAAAAAELSAALPQAAFSTRANTLASAPSPALLHAALLAPP